MGITVIVPNLTETVCDLSETCIESVSIGPGVINVSSLLSLLSLLELELKSEVQILVLWGRDSGPAVADSPSLVLQDFTQVLDREECVWVRSQSTQGWFHL